MSVRHPNARGLAASKDVSSTGTATDAVATDTAQSAAASPLSTSDAHTAGIAAAGATAEVDVPIPADAAGSARSSAIDEPPPFLGTWRNVYLMLVGETALLVVLFYILTRWAS